MCFVSCQVKNCVSAQIFFVEFSFFSCETCGKWYFVGMAREERHMIGEIFYKIVHRTGLISFEEYQAAVARMTELLDMGASGEELDLLAYKVEEFESAENLSAENLSALIDDIS